MLYWLGRSFVWFGGLVFAASIVLAGLVAQGEALRNVDRFHAQTAADRRADLRVCKEVAGSLTQALRDANRLAPGVSSNTEFLEGIGSMILGLTVAKDRQHRQQIDRANRMLVQRQIRRAEIEETLYFVNRYISDLEGGAPAYSDICKRSRPT